MPNERYLLVQPTQDFEVLAPTRLYKRNKPIRLREWKWSSQGYCKDHVHSFQSAVLRHEIHVFHHTYMAVKLLKICPRKYARTLGYMFTVNYPLLSCIVFQWKWRFCLAYLNTEPVLFSNRFLQVSTSEISTETRDCNSAEMPGLLNRPCAHWTQSPLQK